MDRYAINVFWSDADDVWIADAPDLKSCSAHGETPERALAELQIAMDVWLDAARRAGKTIPAAHYRPQHEAAE